jgi:regulatory protein
MKKKDISKSPGRVMDYREALNRASALCSRQELSARHLRDKLNAWYVSEKDAERIIKKLYEEKFLDDHRYAAFFARDKFRFNGWGKIKISYMLRQKDIGEEIIKEALDMIDDDTYFQKCIELIKNKSTSLKDKNQFTRKGKLYRFAAGRGFEPDLIHRILNMLEKE